MGCRKARNAQWYWPSLCHEASKSSRGLDSWTRSASFAEGVAGALRNPGLRAVVVCPSNPFLSIDPILAVPGMRDALSDCRAPVVAVSPLISGRAVKGPTAKIMAELSIPATASAVVTHYRDLLDGFLVDHADAAETEGLPVPCLATRTLMLTLDERDNLARRALEFADRLRDLPATARRTVPVP